MSTSRGSQCRKRPQKHQNRTVYKNDLHDTSRKTKILNSLEVSGVCKRCKDIIQWKIKYKKYKPLTAPAKCIGCNEKAVKHAYHVLCAKCTAEKKVCAKCVKQADNNVEEIQNHNELNQDSELQASIKSLPERKRRTVLRFLRKTGNVGSNLTPEEHSNIGDLLLRMKDVHLDDDEDIDFSDVDLSDNNEEK